MNSEGLSELGETDALEILIVEDDDDARASLCDVLELHEHCVSTRSSAEAALELGERLKAIDVIVLDRKLPDGMVEDLLPRFRAQAPDAEFIVVTGYADLDASIAALRQGVADYIIKPINPEALLATLRRIGVRRRIERELQRERQFAEMVLDTAEAIILVLDTSGRIMRFNRYLTHLTGYSLAEVEYNDWFETFIPEGQRDKIQSVFENTLTDHITRGILNSIRTKSGEQKEIRWSNSVIRDQTGHVTGVLAVGLDVTDLVAAQTKVLRTERLAAIGLTMTGMAHESRNALQRLQNAVELLEDDLQGNAEALRYLNKISRAGNDLRDLLEEVRAYAAPIKLDISLTSLQSIWRRSWQNLEARYGDHHGVLTETLCDDDGLLLNVDARRMEQVFRNLFENAFDACGVDVEVNITEEHKDDLLVISVKDNGPGLTAQHRGRAFDAFYTSKPTGTGLGLAIVQRIIEAHRGSIQVRDHDEGAEFLICLPVDLPPQLPHPE